MKHDLSGIPEVFLKKLNSKSPEDKEKSEEFIKKIIGRINFKVNNAVISLKEALNLGDECPEDIRDYVNGYRDTILDII